MRDLNALLWMTLSVARRLLREPQVVRSVLWPIALGPIVLVLTAVAWVWVEGDWPIAVDPGTPTEVLASLHHEGWVTIEVKHARDAVAEGAYRLGTDGHTVFTGADRGRSLELERVLRERVGAPWMAGKPVPPTYTTAPGSRLVGAMGFQFVLYGVVFGAGMVARDRDDGTLEAELTLGVARWIHGTSRWLAATAVLTIHFALACIVIHALMGVSDIGAQIRNGGAACGTAVAIGLLVIGRGGLKSGFSGPLAAGITCATVLASIGLTKLPGVSWVPIGSLLCEGSGWGALATSAPITVLAIVLFTRRSAQA